MAIVGLTPAYIEKIHDELVAIRFPDTESVGYGRNTGLIESAANRPFQSAESGLGVESLQRSFSEKAAEVFPPIPYQSKVFRRDGRECLAVIVPGSPFRPHYAGLPYIRVGTESRKADADDVARLLAEQDPKAREILKWKGKIVAVDGFNPPDTFSRMDRVNTSGRAKIMDCNQFWVTYEYGQGALTSISLRRVELCFDHPGGLLKLEISP